ncbi:hypothetical protein [Lactiplantibacillus plajomi]|uniref:Uncharacterized protein n=1 Tax=Lactiplantibacillus plajomi TaxID=1457217 RepID=A0ABV6JZV9_9LACO|nr:hypothetical protein [Lactiplantibacillus plajomi]
MWGFRRSVKPVFRTPVGGDLQLKHSQRTLVVRHLNNNQIFAPTDGEVRWLSSTAMLLRCINGETYLLKLMAASGQFNWLVRVGDSVSPLTLIATLSADCHSNVQISCQPISTGAVQSQPTDYIFE